MSPSTDADTPAPDSGRGGVCAEESSGEDHSRHSQGKHLLNMEVYTTHCMFTYTYNYTVVYFTSRSECFLLVCS